MATIYTKKINKVEIKEENKNDRKYSTKYEDLFTDRQPFYNLLIIGKKFSGKSFLMRFIINQLTHRKTIVNIFNIGSYESDTQYIKLFKDFKKYKINCNVYEDLIEDGSNILDDIFEEGVEKLIAQKDRYPKYLYPTFVNIFDDFNSELNDNEKLVEYYLAKHRHSGSINIILCESLMNLKSEKTRGNIDIIIIFSGESIERLKTIWQEFCNNITLNQFLDIYHDATKEKYNFLWIYKNQEFRHNFNTEYIIK